MSEEWKTALVAYMESHGKVGDADSFVEMAQLVCSFIADRMEQNEPYAKRTIGALREVADTLDGYEEVSA